MLLVRKKLPTSLNLQALEQNHQYGGEGILVMLKVIVRESGDHLCVPRSEAMMSRRYSIIERNMKDNVALAFGLTGKRIKPALHIR